MQQTEVVLKLNLNEDIRRVRLIERNYESLQRQIKQIYSIGRSFSLKYKDDEGDQVTISSQQEFEEALNSISNNLLHLKVSVLENQNEEKDKGMRCGRFRNWKEHCKRWRNVQNDEKIDENHQHHQHPHSHFKHPFQKFQRDQHHSRHPFHHHHPHSHFQHPFQRFQKDEQDPSFDHQSHHFPAHPFAFLHNLKNIAKNFIFQQSDSSDSSDSLVENLLNSGFCKLEHNHICDGCEVRISGTRYHCTECEDFDFCSDCYENKINSHPLHKFEEITALQALKQTLENGQQIDSFFVFGENENENEKNEKENPEKEVKQVYGQEQEKQKIEKEVEEEKLKKEILEKELLEQETQKQRVEKEKEIEKERLENEKLNKIDLNLSPQPKDVLFPLRNQSEESNIVYSFESKLQDLQVMGFNDRKKNIVALVQNKGDIQLAIEHLLNQN